MAIRILIADDHTLMRAGLRRILDDEVDIEVVAEAEDGAAADGGDGVKIQTQMAMRRDLLAAGAWCDFLRTRPW